ncbi:MAG: [Clostridia bacterium]|nr:[citrate (pro-3S)-lyase] ligase [Clostridia bacterium]
MDISLFPAPLQGRLGERYKDFLFSCGLRDEADADVIVLMTDDDFAIVACGARAGHTLKQFAVSPAIEGGGACASILSALQSEAMQRGIARLFLCTKPQNLRMFASMGFYPIVSTADAVLTENRRNGFSDYLASLPRFDGVRGAVVMNADPFTRGHLHLLEYAAAHCDALYVFAVSEDGSLFSPEERYAMIERGSAHIRNRVVCRSDMYLVSRATFPAYFIRDESRVDAVRSDLDIELFRTRIAPALGITKRFVGEEPFSPTTRAYNERMKALLPEKGIELIEIPRLADISASRVRALLRAGEYEKTAEAVPETTYETILRHFGTDA